jgi:hypothetical protein
MELFKMGLIPPDKALRYLEMSETGRMYEEMQVDARQAQRENIKMKEGMQIPVNNWDNHIAHMMEHDNYRKRQEYEMLDIETQALFQEHTTGHKVFILTHKGIPQQIVDQAAADPSGMELDRLLFMPGPAQMAPEPPPPGNHGLSHGPPLPPPGSHPSPQPPPGNTPPGNAPLPPPGAGLGGPH